LWPRRSWWSYQSIDVNDTKLVVCVNHNRRYRRIKDHSIDSGQVDRTVNCRITDPNRTRLASHTGIADVDVVITGSQVDSCARTQRDVAVTGGVKKQRERSVGCVAATGGIA
jgi:hypothetical protein